jgi:antitoxin (DNA-binding transcriptional repressor) of toxin-antitoxin stability system
MDRPKETVGIAELKARLSATLRLVKGGATVIIEERGHPVARLVPHGPPGPLPGIRKATRDPASLKLPAPLGRRIDLDAALRAERKDRR